MIKGVSYPDPKSLASVPEERAESHGPFHPALSAFPTLQT